MTQHHTSYSRQIYRVFTQALYLLWIVSRETTRALLRLLRFIFIRPRAKRLSGPWRYAPIRLTPTILLSATILSAVWFVQKFDRRHWDQALLSVQFRATNLARSAILFEPLWNNHDINQYIREASARHGVDEDLIHAVIQAESGYNTYAISRTGACGIMQLMPATIGDLGHGDPFHPRENIEMGARYLAWLKKRFPSRTEWVAAAYNAGPGAVSRHGGIPPFEQTRQYVKRVMATYRERKA